MRAAIVDIIENIIPLINNRAKIETIVDNGDGTSTITVCDPLWVVPCIILTIESTTHKVKDISKVGANYDIIVYDVVNPVATEYEVALPFYTHGTPNSVNTDKILTDKIEYPFIYAFEPIPETIYRLSDKDIDRESSVNILFMAETKPEDWDNDNYYTYAVKPMMNLADAFFDAINTNTGFFTKVRQTKEISISKMVEMKGSVGDLLTNMASGREAVFTLGIRDKFISCKCN
jgi:hypothetical protein